MLLLCLARYRSPQRATSQTSCQQGQKHNRTILLLTSRRHCQIPTQCTDLPHQTLQHFQPGSTLFWCLFVCLFVWRVTPVKRAHAVYQYINTHAMLDLLTYTLFPIFPLHARLNICSQRCECQTTRRHLLHGRRLQCRCLNGAVRFHVSKQNWSSVDASLAGLCIFPET